jgi:hypothetical protein
MPSPLLLGLIKMAPARSPGGAFGDVLEHHLGAGLAGIDIGARTSSAMSGQRHWGCAFEDFLAREPVRSAIVEVYLKRCGWNEAQNKTHDRA